MKLVYAVGQRTNPKRPSARHIDNGEGKPLCGATGASPSSGHGKWENPLARFV